ncbi:hypothetical protein SAMN05216475_6296 [Pseudomonas synxantha]|uniref:Phage protein n=1 Tax=Pseudomonas synxantha TaxID=47883 RepID=A0AAX3I0D9_9PSED|nr:hypothetical protein [Pseudomonas synxantha]KRP50250.1 hypothetical protein TU77_23415 [Pseudomonas synxantha]SDU69035.1 hypothetical protein SAMN05216475_6296 [Pseudomonas synxantha]VTQ88110.1 Uncharacterised protein [Pseudomonas synxantha]
MTDQAKNDAQPVIDAVVVGDAQRLLRALRGLAKALPEVFIRVTGQLLSTKQCESVSAVCFGFGAISDFYHVDGKVFGAVYTDTFLLIRQAGPMGVGMAYEEVRKLVLEVRAEYDETVLKKAMQLKESLEELDRLLSGHSFADSKLTSMAHADLFKGQALLVAALNPIKRE